MSWVRFSLKHPVPTIVFFLVALVVGAVSITRLSVDLYPAMEYPLALVATNYEGAGPQEVEALVTRPIEESLGTVAGVTNIRSYNYEGQSLVVAQFDWGTDMDQATLTMRDKIDRVKGYLPDDADSPIVFKIDPQALPVLTIGVSGNVEPAELKRIAEEKLKRRLERLDGVASVTIVGGADREIQVILDPRRLAAHGISINQVAQALRYENLNLPGGDVKEGSMKLLVRTLGQFSSPDEIRDLRIGPVRLGDVAEVRDTFGEMTARVTLNGNAAVGIDIMKQAGANTVTVVQAVKDELAKLQADLPAGVKAEPLMDQSNMVLNSIDSIASSGVEGGLLAILVLLLFLRHFRATLAVAIAIPISVITTFGPLFFGGVTMNMMSMGGLALGVGMMVDASIVVLENIFRHKEAGKEIDAAVLDGAGEVALAVSASTLTTVVVFLPVVWITGLAQQYFKELALSVTYSLMTSMAVSLTLVPILARALLRDRPARVRKPPSRVYVWLTAKLDALDAAYGRLLGAALRNPGKVLGAAAAAAALAVVFFGQMGMEFIPHTDTSEFRISIKLPPGTRLEETEQAVGAAAAMVRQVPELRALYTSAGSADEVLTSRQSGSHEGYLVGFLTRPGERDRSLDQIMEELRRRVEIPGAKVTINSSGMLDPGGVPIEVLIKGDDLGVLEELARQVAEEIRAVAGTREIALSIEESLPEVQIKVDRARAASYGVSPSQVALAVSASVKGEVVSQYRTGTREFDIRLRATPEARQDVAALQALPVASAGGQPVPLGEVASIRRGTGPAMVERDDRARVVRVTGQLYNRDLGSVMDDVKARLELLPKPPGYELEYGGQDAQMNDAFGGLIKALLFSIVLVYLLMAAQFESWLHPLVIMFTVPLSFVGAIGALVATGRSMDISGMIGVILLVGIVVDNAIVLVDYINQLRSRGMGVEEAIRAAGPTRLRPVLMTTLTTLLGLLPLALGMGEGSDLQAPMATVVIGGLSLSTLLTLVVIPVIYRLVDDGVEWVSRRVRAGV